MDTEKAKTTDFLPISTPAAVVLKMWVVGNYSKIQAHDGFLFYSENHGRKTENLSPNWVRREFRSIAVKAGLNMAYGEAEDARNPIIAHKGHRSLYRLTTHSFRHFFGTNSYNLTKDLVKTQKLLRHKSIHSTLVYTHTSRAELDVIMGQIGRMLQPEQKAVEMPVIV